MRKGHTTRKQGWLRLDCEMISDSSSSIPGMSEFLGDRVSLSNLGYKTEYIGMGRTVTSLLGVGQAVVTTQNCFLWADQNLKESAVLSNGPGRGEGRESPFICIRAGRVWGGQGGWELGTHHR